MEVKAERQKAQATLVLDKLMNNKQTNLKPKIQGQYRTAPNRSPQGHHKTNFSDQSLSPKFQVGSRLEILAQSRDNTKISAVKSLKQSEESKMAPDVARIASQRHTGRTIAKT